jgi:hypothetical protein
VKKALPFILLGAAGLLLCIGVSALAVNFVSSRSPSVDTSKWITPQEQVDTQKIIPGVAIAILAGTSDSASVDDSLAAGDFEGAFAQIAYGTEFSDANRVGTLLLLGNRYAAAKQTTKAAWMYQYAVFLAVVSPLPSDLNRVQTLLEAAQGLKALNMDSNARAVLDQAYLIAEYSPALPRDTRAQVAEQIARLYDRFGASKLAQNARQLANDTITLADESAVNLARRPFRIQPTDPPANPDIVAKLKERVAAARELVDALNLNPPKSEADLPDDLVRALGDKLYEEDGLRMAYYASQYDASPDASSQLGVLRDKLTWLAIKYRIAKKGFGISLVPEWEDQAADIAQQLNDTYADYFAITQQQAQSLDKTDESNRSIEDLLRGAIVAGRWGIYSQYDEADLRSQLDTVSQALRDQQVASLRLDSFMRGKQVVYLLVPDELYGMGERALPR